MTATRVMIRISSRQAVEVALTIILFKEGKRVEESMVCSPAV